MTTGATGGNENSALMPSTPAIVIDVLKKQGWRIVKLSEVPMGWRGSYYTIEEEL